VQVHFVYVAQSPAAGDRDTRAIGGSLRLVRNVVLWAEQVDDLVVVVTLDCFDERDSRF
jgi:hypothetical protein